RRKTTPYQLGVLESVFRENPKPTSKMRERLAEQLGMLPRSVQVWFQNRRAKEKGLLKAT
ncbi:homeobox domain-containing protein, partial [Gaertneriomyces semiglobifer]